METELVIIGGGNMGTAMLSGLLDSGDLGAHDLAVVEPDPQRRSALEAEFPGVAMWESVKPANSAILAVKPQHVPDALSTAVEVGIGRVLSVAAGVTTAAMHQIAGDDVVLIRAMPNTPALVGEGVIAIAGGPGTTAADLDWAESVLAATGLVVRVDEEHLDAVTGLTGSGPAYIFLFAEALIEAGRREGIPDALVEPMVTQLLVGTSKLLAQRGDPAALRVAVTSPGGTTAAGLATLNDRAVPAAIEAAVRAATERSGELGR